MIDSALPATRREDDDARRHFGPAAWACRRSALVASAPVAENRLDEGQHSDRRRVGAQDARPERDADDAGQAEDERSLRVVEAAFGADDHGELFRGGPGLSKGGGGAGHGRVLVAEYDQALGLQAPNRR